MNDIANRFYNTWVAVKGAKGPAKLLCTWHVDKVWKEELRKKVGDASAEAEIYKIIFYVSGADFWESFRGLPPWSS